MNWYTLPVSYVGVVAYPANPHWAFLILKKLLGTAACPC